MITRIQRPTKDIHSGESTTIRVELYSLGNQLANTEIEPRTETVVQTVYHDHGTAIDLWDGTTLVFLRQHAWPKVGRSARSDRFFFFPYAYRYRVCVHRVVYTECTVFENTICANYRVSLGPGDAREWTVIADCPFVGVKSFLANLCEPSPSPFGRNVRCGSIANGRVPADLT